MTYEDQMLMPLEGDLKGERVLPSEGTGKKKTEQRIDKNFRRLIKWVDEILDGGLNHQDIAGLHVRLIVLFFGTEQKKDDIKKVKLISDLLEKAEKSLKSHKEKKQILEHEHNLEVRLNRLEQIITGIVSDNKQDK